jgi:hypothetical protein
MLKVLWMIYYNVWGFKIVWREGYRYSAGEAVIG